MVSPAASPGGSVIGATWKRLTPWLVAAIFVVAMGLRLGLALVNRQANDDHLQVAHLIVLQRALPVRADCWECFQPKLYHAAIAGLFAALPWLSTVQQIVLAQLVNVAAGGLTLLFVWRFLVWQIEATVPRLLCFALVAFNPALTGINAQATNDSFAILFGMLALYCAARFVGAAGARPAMAWRYSLGLTAATILAALAKGTGLVILLAILATLALLAWRHFHAAHTFPGVPLGAAGLLLLAFLAVVPAAGQYWYNWANYGSPFVINTARDPLPHLFESSYVYWAGVTSIADGYLTFRLDSLLQYPYDTYDDTGYPRHRNSLWSQLYGAANLAQFEEFPPTWASWHPVVQIMGRVIFVMALLPTLAWLAGLARGTWVTATAFFRRQESQPSDRLTWLFTFAGLGYAAMIVAYTLQYRSFVTMKAVYVMPGMLATVYFLGRSPLWAGRGSWGQRVLAVVCAMLGVLALLYVADLGVLWYQLFRNLMR